MVMDGLGKWEGILWYKDIRAFLEYGYGSMRNPGRSLGMGSEKRTGGACELSEWDAHLGHGGGESVGGPAGVPGSCGDVPRKSGWCAVSQRQGFNQNWQKELID